jgi:DNA-binding MarR family transcriptional regulator
MLDSVDALVAAWNEEMPEVPGLVLQIAKRAARLHALLEATVSAELAKLGLARAEFEVLATLRRVGAPYRMKPSVLATPEVTASGGINKVADRMVAAGLVRAHDDPVDGRGSWLELTDKGVRFAETSVRNVAGAHEALLARAPKHRVQELGDVLRQVLEAMGEAGAEARTSRH